MHVFLHHSGKHMTTLLLIRTHKSGVLGRARWLKHFGRPRLVDPLKSGVRDQSGQHGETPSLKKKNNTKLAGCGGACL